MKILIGASVGLAMVPLLIIWPGEVSAQNVYGDVSFVNSGPEEVQEDFLRGLAQLHNFEYDDAAKYFRQAERAAPEFAMAYWGEAMTKNHAVWHEQDLAAGREVLGRLGATPEIRSSKAPTAREKAYLHT